MDIRQKAYWKRVLSLVLAAVMCISLISVPAYADGSIPLIRRANIFSNRTLTVFGKTHYSMGYYQEGLESGAMPTFCLEPGKRMPNGEKASYQIYTADAGGTIPGVGGSDRFVPITLAYDWMVSAGNMRDLTRYGVVQVYIWGCTAGYGEDWDAQRAAQKRLAAILGNRVMDEFEELYAYVEEGLEEFSAGANGALPAWNNTQQRMSLEEGEYRLSLDLSSCPQLKSASWTLPDADWSYRISGDAITFYYRGSSAPAGQITSSELSGVGGMSRFYAYIFTPGEGSGFQRQLGRFAGEERGARASFTVGSFLASGEESEFEVYRHSETFDADYSIRVEKYCAETNQPLEGTTFDVWEDFDESQLSGSDYAEGEPDGRFGVLYDNRFEPFPQGNHVCGQITTDEAGKGAHRDVRSYAYSKTYCLGHPAPQLLEVPDEETDPVTGEIANGDEIAAVEEENERLLEVWHAQQELCEATCDFHVGNEDEENHDSDESAMEEMIRDRDATYEAFIGLRYDYSLTEVTARTGYILHSVHSEDEPIERVSVAAAQAGENAQALRGAGAGTKRLERGESSQSASKPRRASFWAAAEVRQAEVASVSQMREDEEAVASTSQAEADVIFFADEDDWEEASPSEASASNATASNACAVGAASPAQAEWQEENGWFYRLLAPKPIAFVWQLLFGGKTDGDFSVELPEFMDDDLESVDISDYGDSSTVLYAFRVWDHRTEGELHINKRDLELDEALGEESVGKTQGDATLQGAVYGLFAAQDLVHPDGKTGTVYAQNDLVAVATTDENGDAAFLVNTEKPGTRLDADGNIQTPDGVTGPENLYNGGMIVSSDHGFGTREYPDYVTENGNCWIGRPLLLGSYYVMELSRSEGYEISVTGSNRAESNRGGTKEQVVLGAGRAAVSAGLSDYSHMDADGSWNDFVVESYGTADGYDVVVSGYPEGTTFYRMEVHQKEEVIPSITGSVLAPKRDSQGNIIYQKALGGEYKTGADGLPIIKEESDPTHPMAETTRYRFGTRTHASGEAVPDDPTRWQEAVGDLSYLEDEVNGLLAQLGFLETGEEAAWSWIALEGETNEAVGLEILDWAKDQGIWDSVRVERIEEREDQGLRALMRFDDSKLGEAGAIYDPLSKELFVKKTATLTDAQGEQVRYWVRYANGSYTMGSATATVKEKRELPKGVTLAIGDEVEAQLVAVYLPSYETYAPGEVLCDENGDPIPVMERTYTRVEDATQIVDEERAIELSAVRDPKSGDYTIHVENTVDWEETDAVQYTRFRAKTQQTSIRYEGEEMPYNEYLTQVAGAGVSAFAPLPTFDEGSYVISLALAYPGQNQVWQDDGTREHPGVVRERVIRQAIRVTKDIAQTSYDGVNTYGAVHNDPLTAFLGLFTGNTSGTEGAKSLPGFRFKLYLKSDLTELVGNDGNALLERKGGGTPDYVKFFDALYTEAARTEHAVGEFARKYHLSEEEAEAYLRAFSGLEKRLAVAWDGEANGGADKDETTLSCSRGNGKDGYYGESRLLPYGTYVIVEQTATGNLWELANRHYSVDYPKEVTLPFVPQIDGEQVDAARPDSYFSYNALDTPEDLIRKYKIRFNEETHRIAANRDGEEFFVYKYGLEPDCEPGNVADAPLSRSENSETLDQVQYEAWETASGEVEIRDHVAAMKGVGRAIDGKYAPMLVPWTIRKPVVDQRNPDTGELETLVPSGSGEAFNYVAWAQEDFENRYASTRLRVEKLDAQTRENILHDGALFRIYAAKRDVKKGETGIEGSGNVLFSQAVDAEGKTVTDSAGNPILYPRVGKSNGSDDDLPIRLDAENNPIYDESQMIRQYDETGSETGIFRAYSTVQEVEKDGVLTKETVGYLKLPKPLGAGAYVLVEIQAPEGYVKSRPVAFELYADHAQYYEEARNADATSAGWQEVDAPTYQYAKPVDGESDKVSTETMTQVSVIDYPSRVEIYKVEDGDSLVGNENGLKETDEQGNVEVSGGFLQDVLVNDAGDGVIYRVYGRKEYLKARGDVRNIAYDAQKQMWFGEVTKAMDAFSEHIVEGSELELKAMERVKVLYGRDGTFSGKGIRFDIPVAGAKLALYEAIELEEAADGYKGVTVYRKDGKVERIENTNTGRYQSLQVTGTDAGEGKQPVWDAAWEANDPVDLYFVDLDTTPTRCGADGALVVLDARGNEICFADPESGMAYVLDGYGRKLAYVLDGKGERVLVRSIQVSGDGQTQTLYPDRIAKEDENGLPIYYQNADPVYQDERWTSGESGHLIARLPFGAYILEEETVAHGQGYVQASHLGLVLEETQETQKFFLQNAFTKAAFSKVDVRTQKEIVGAQMTLYTAKIGEEGLPIRDEEGNYKKDAVYASWISGYAYDDDGNLKQDETGEPILTTEPHWIDHLPIGAYVLEETSVPYEQGYVQTASMSIDVKETGNVQTFVMEDDFTGFEVKKYDTKSGEVLYGESVAYLALYPAILDGEGNPIVDANGVPEYDPASRIVTFRAPTYADGKKVAATGRTESDAAGEHPIQKYDYEYHPIEKTAKGRYYYTQDATVRFEYLPVGDYVLAERTNPQGYATADPILIRVDDQGHLVEIPTHEMGDAPLTLCVDKVAITGGKEVNGARLSIYPVRSDGSVSDEVLVIRRPGENGAYEDGKATWISGADGVYTQSELEAGEIPDGFAVGDLKPHIVTYIPEGDYVLLEETVPYGFLQAVRVPFTVLDTGEIQGVEMIDEIPDGVLCIEKSDSEESQKRLAGAQFTLKNKTLGIVCEVVTTDENGEAEFSPVPIGFQNEKGDFSPYTYECEETKAAPGYMMTLAPWEFQFAYIDSQTPDILLKYQPENDSNRVRVDKLKGDTEEFLEGAQLMIERLDDPTTPDVDESAVVDTWTTTKQPHYSKGLAAGTYRLSEKETPGAGYKILAEPMEFVIEDGMREVPHLVMRNYSAVVEVQKVIASGDRMLAGAKLQLLFADREEVIDEWTSSASEGHRIYGLAEGTYRIRELEAPSGYTKRPEQVVTVTGDDASVQVIRFENRLKSSGGGDHTPSVPKEHPLRVHLTKIDGVSGEGLGGARVRILDKDTETVVFEALMDAAGKLTFSPKQAGTYVMEEVEAPEGYEKTDERLEFTVDRNGRVNGQTQLKNYKRERTVGRVTASYRMRFEGNLRRGPQDAKTGDNRQEEVLWMLGIFCLGVAMCLMRKKRREDE